MIKYNEKVYNSYLDLYYAMMSEIIPFNERVFINHKYFYCKAVLEQKFNRKFSLKEVKTLIDEEFPN